MNCWSLRIGFRVVCHVPQMFACSSDMVSEEEAKDRSRTSGTTTTLLCDIQIQKFTFGTPSVSSRLSVPASHLPYHAVLPWDPKKLFTSRASWVPSPLAQDWGVVVVRGHFSTGRFVGVARGPALAQGVGLLCL